MGISRKGEHMEPMAPDNGNRQVETAGKEGEGNDGMDAEGMRRVVGAARAKGVMQTGGQRRGQHGQGERRQGWRGLRWRGLCLEDLCCACSSIGGSGARIRLSTLARLLSSTIRVVVGSALTVRLADVLCCKGTVNFSFLALVTVLYHSRL
jgi:hypothetical protein